MRAIVHGGARLSLLSLEIHTKKETTTFEITSFCDGLPVKAHKTSDRLQAVLDTGLSQLTSSLMLDFARFQFMVIPRSSFGLPTQRPVSIDFSKDM
jgi:hypothetical protein